MNVLSFDDVPFAQRNDTMFLSTVDSKCNVTALPPRRDPMYTDDIHGSSVPGPRFPNKPPQTYDGIPGSRSMQLHPLETNKPNYMLQTADIDGAHPCKVRFTSERVVDPLVPRYKLPSYEEQPVPPTKLLRETNVLDDIYGTAPKQLYPFDKRATLRTDDIEGASVKSRFRTRSGSEYTSLEVQDINRDGQFRTQRRVDIMSPRYRYDVPTTHEQQEILCKNSYILPTGEEAGSVVEWAIGKIDRNHPRPARRAHADIPYFPLSTSDIEGCHVGSLNVDHRRRRHFKNINYISDIDGSWANSKVPLRTLKTIGPGMLEPPRPQSDTAPISCYAVEFSDPKNHTKQVVSAPPSRAHSGRPPQPHTVGSAANGSAPAGGASMPPVSGVSSQARMERLTPTLSPKPVIPPIEKSSAAATRPHIPPLPVNTDYHTRAPPASASPALSSHGASPNALTSTHGRISSSPKVSGMGGLINAFANKPH